MSTDTTLAKSITSFDARPEAQWPMAEINRWLETAQAENVILLAQQVLDLAAEVERLRGVSDTEIALLARAEAAENALAEMRRYGEQPLPRSD